MRLLSVVGAFALVASIACNPSNPTVPTSSAPATQASEQDGTVTAQEGTVGFPYCWISSVEPFVPDYNHLIIHGYHGYKAALVYVQVRTNEQGPWFHTIGYSSPFQSTEYWAHTSHPLIAYLELHWQSNGELACSHSYVVGY